MRAEVPWRDLVACSRVETLRELALPLPWLIGGAWAAHVGAYALAVPCAFYAFLTCLRVSHNAFHGALGLGRTATDLVMLALGIVMLGSVHAVRRTHLLHHRHCLGDGDVEGRVARQGLLETLAKGPRFPLDLHRAGWRAAAPDERRWIGVELAACAALPLLAWGVLESEALRLHTLMMGLAWCLSPVFAVWSVHRADATGRHGARTLRSRWRSTLFYDMFYHDEHHRFPRVPTRHLPELARRLDRVGTSAAPDVFEPLR